MVRDEEKRQQAKRLVEIEERKVRTACLSVHHPPFDILSDWQVELERRSAVAAKEAELRQLEKQLEEEMVREQKARHLER